MNSLFEGQFDNRVFTLERLEFELFVDGFKLSFVSFGQLFKHEGEKLTEEVQQFKIVLLDRHFDIETNELTHVSMGE